MRELGSVFVRALCSANRPRMRPPCGVAQGFRLVEVFSRGVCAGSGVEQNDENGEGEENCDSSNAPRNMRRLRGFWWARGDKTIHMSLTVGSCANACALITCAREKYASVPSVLCVRRGVLSSSPVACTTVADVCTPFYSKKTCRRTDGSERLYLPLFPPLLILPFSLLWFMPFLDCHQTENEHDACDQLTFQFQLCRSKSDRNFSSNARCRSRSFFGM